MQFNILPADIAANCNTKIFTDRSCRTLHTLTVSTVDDGNDYGPSPRAMGAVLESGRIYFTHNSYVISFEIFWENAVGGRSVVVVKNVGGDQTDANFLRVFDIFKDILETRMVEDFVDLTI